MTAQIRFALRLYRHGGRWLAPLALLMIWFLFAIENAPPAFDTLAALFPAFLAAGCWIAASLGDVDDRNHREMAAAAAGSLSRLHRARSLASMAVCGVAATLQALYITFALDHADTAPWQVFGVCLATLLSASALGVAIGSWLHAPLLARRAVGVAIGFVAITAIVLFGPVQDALRRVGNTELAPAVMLAGVATVSAAGIATAASVAAGRSAS